MFKVNVEQTRRDLGWKRIEQELKYAKNSIVKVGFPGEDDHAHDKSGITVASLATIHEFGTESGHIPPRPFMSTALERYADATSKYAASLWKRITRGKLSARQALRLLGEKGVGDTKRTLTDGPWTPNAPSTAATKGSSRPLIDSGTLRRAITSRVVEGKR